MASSNTYLILNQYSYCFRLKVPNMGDEIYVALEILRIFSCVSIYYHIHSLW